MALEFKAGLTTLGVSSLLGLCTHSTLAISYRQRQGLSIS